MHVVSVTRHSSSLAISMKRKTPRVVREELYKEPQGTSTRYAAPKQKAQGRFSLSLVPTALCLLSAGEFLRGTPCRVPIGDHYVEDCLFPFFRPFDQSEVAHAYQVLFHPFALLAVHAALGNIDGKAREM